MNLLSIVGIISIIAASAYFTVTFIRITIYRNESERMIKAIGKIKCSRCGYQGKPKAIAGGMLSKILIVCPDCNWETWEKLPN